MTFNLQFQDENEDEEASDESATADKAASTSQSSLATSDKKGKQGSQDAKDAKKKHKVPEEDVIVKFDRYLGTQWQKFLKKNHFSPYDRDASNASGEGEHDAGVQLRRRGVARSSLFGGLSGGSKGGADRDSYKKRVDSEMAASDFLE